MIVYKIYYTVERYVDIHANAISISCVLVFGVCTFHSICCEFVFLFISNLFLTSFCGRNNNNNNHNHMNRENVFQICIFSVYKIPSFLSFKDNIHTLFFHILFLPFKRVILISSFTFKCIKKCIEVKELCLLINFLLYFNTEFSYIV